TVTLLSRVRCATRMRIPLPPSSTLLPYTTLFRSGVYVSLDGGASFMALMGQTSAEGRLPEAPVHDLKVHPRDADLIVGTHGRSRSEEHTSELQSVKISYAVFCLK